jgi:hypothetical protein
MEEYILVKWPEVQELMEKEWFQEEAILALGNKEITGDSAYFIPKERMDKLQKQYMQDSLKEFDIILSKITDEQIEKLRKEFNIFEKTESEEEITDTMRLDWLEQTYSDDEWLHEVPLNNLTIREFIDKQLKQK